MKIAAIALCGVSMFVASQQQAMAWGDDGHKTVALIAEQFLTPTAKREGSALLPSDTDPLPPHIFASAATWADRFREANHRRDNYDPPRRWHYVDLEIE